MKLDNKMYEHLKRLAKKHNLTIKEVISRLILKENLKIIDV